mgnify:CR=1 FL=1
MAAFRGINLRSGDLAEQLGLLLLQNVSLVSQIPRTEDVGIDAVITLIREFDKYKFIAEDSFYVQIKSSSIHEIIFKDEQVKWLTELQLPFFIALVNRKKSEVYLYCAHYLSDVLATNPNRKEIILDLTDASDYDCCDSSQSIKVPIGPCVISWSLDIVGNNKNFIGEFYKLLKTHVTIAKKSIETRRVGVVELVKWETGKAPAINGTKIKPFKDSYMTDEVISPYFSALLQQFSNGESIYTARSLYSLLEKILERENHFIMVDGKKELIPFTVKLKNEKS